MKFTIQFSKSKKVFFSLERSFFVQLDDQIDFFPLKLIISIFENCDDLKFKIFKNSVVNLTSSNVMTQKV